MIDSPINKQVFVDHYVILGLTPGANPVTIKQNFRMLARKHHPDMQDGNAMRFLEIYNAYQVLFNPETRLMFDQQYWRYALARKQQMQLQLCKRIPLDRVSYSGNVVQFARRGLLRKKFRNRDRRRLFNIDFDLQVALTESELRQPILVYLPLVARYLCPDCRGSNPNCAACNGRGYHKTSRLVQIEFAGGLSVGQILDLDFSHLKPGPMSHFKRKRIRLRIERQQENRPLDHFARQRDHQGV